MTRITDEGQLPIPADIRERLGLEPGAEIEFAVQDGTLLIKRVPSPENETRGERAVRLLRGRGNWPGRTTDEIMEFLRGE
jgi:AbrB family looped-hinge helix DNA binding protein